MNYTEISGQIFKDLREIEYKKMTTINNFHIIKRELDSIKSIALLFKENEEEIASINRHLINYEELLIRKIENEINGLQLEASRILMESKLQEVAAQTALWLKAKDKVESRCEGIVTGTFEQHFDKKEYSWEDALEYLEKYELNLYEKWQNLPDEYKNKIEKDFSLMCISCESDLQEFWRNLAELGEKYNKIVNKEIVQKLKDLGLDDKIIGSFLNNPDEIFHKFMVLLGQQNFVNKEIKVSSEKILGSLLDVMNYIKK